MNIVIVNGSPKRELSVTLQGARYLEKRFPEHRFTTLHVAPKVARPEESFAALRAADALLWTTPVYFNLVPAQLKRFVEQLFEAPPGMLKGKYASSITTSAHFYDHLAHEYLHGISEDLGMKYAVGLSFGDSYLLDEKGRQTLFGFGRYFFSQIERRMPAERVFEPLNWKPLSYSPKEAPTVAAVEKSARGITVVTDAREGDRNLNSMIEVFRRLDPHAIEVLNLNDVDIKGGCLGCLQCSVDGHCVYRDGFETFFDERIGGAGTLVFAGTIRDRYLSSRFKTYFDRGFVNGHRPFLSGRFVGFIVSGPLRQLPSLRQGLEGMMQVAQAETLGFVTDEEGDEASITEGIKALHARIALRAGAAWQRPNTFLGIGGHKVFRDLVYANSAVMRADHRYYAAHGLYDYPSRDLRLRFKNLLLRLLPIPRDLTTRMVAPYRRIVDMEIDPGIPRAGASKS